MTVALCLSCGEIKFGALNSCIACGASPSGNMDLDILFTDHYYDQTTLKEFGAVIAVIGTKILDRKLKFWAFLNHISDHYPEVLTIKLEPETRSKIQSVLRNVDLPLVVVHKSNLG